MSGRFFLAAIVLACLATPPAAAINVRPAHNHSSSGKAQNVALSSLERSYVPDDRASYVGSVGTSLRSVLGGWQSSLRSLQNVPPITKFLQANSTAEQPLQSPLYSAAEQLHGPLQPSAPFQAAVPLQPLSCLPDMPGNFTTAGIAMIFAMVLVAIVVKWLLDQPSTTPTTRLPITSQPAMPSRPNIRTLDGLRTVFITYIVIIHFPQATPESIVPLLADGWAMQFFTVLSGFVAFYVMSGKCDTLDWATGSKWVGRRLARLAVLHQVAILADYGRVAYLGGPCTANQCRPLIAWPMNAMFMQGLLPVRICGAPGDDATWNYIHFNANGVGWFTACLAWISVAFPFLYNSRPRSGINSTNMLLGLIVFVRFLSEVFCPAWAMWGGSGVLHPYAFVPLRLLEFWAGMLTAQAAGQASFEFRSWKGWGWAFDVFLLAGFGGVAWVVRDYSASAMRTGEYYMIPMWCLVCMAAAFVVERPEVERKGWLAHGPVHTILASSPVVYLAQYSYGTYQLHQVTLRWVFALGGPMNFYIFPLNIVLSWLIGAFATTCMESPFLKAIEDRLKIVAKKEASMQEPSIVRPSMLTPACPIFH